MRTLVIEPGRLTAEHRDGRRQPWLPPLALFLAVNVVFFIGQMLSGLSVLSLPLSSHLEHQRYSGIARHILDQRLARRPLDRARFEDRFEAQQRTLSKASAIAMAPLLALASGLLFGRGARPASRSHLVFALHFYAFMLAFLTVFFLLSGPGLVGLHKLGWMPDNASLDNIASAIEAGVIATYAFIAGGRVFGGSRLRRLVAACGMVYAVVAILYLHRFAVFVVTTWTV